MCCGIVKEGLLLAIIANYEQIEKEIVNIIEGKSVSEVLTAHQGPLCYPVRKELKIEVY